VKSQKNIKDMLVANKKILVVAGAVALVIALAVTAVLVLPRWAQQRAQRATAARIAQQRTQKFTVVKPRPADLSSPESAARSYADWAAYALAVGDADTAKATMTDVAAKLLQRQIDSGKQLNFQQLKRLLDFSVSSRTDEKNARVALTVKETWQSSRAPLSPRLTSRDAGTTEELRVVYRLKKGDNGWQVDRVVTVSRKTLK